MQATSTPQPMYPHAYLAGTTVNSREHARQRRALRAGITTLAAYQASR